MSEENKSAIEGYDLDEEESQNADEAIASGVDPEFERRKGKKLTEAERAEARELFELGKETASALADRFGVTRQAMSRYFKQEGVKYGSRAHEVQAATNAGVKAAAAAFALRYSENRMAWIEESRVRAYNDLKGAFAMAKQIVVDAVQNKTPLANVDPDLKAAQRYTRIAKENYMARLEILDAANIVNSDDLPDLKIDDLSAQNVKDFHKLNGVEDPDELEEIIDNFEKDIT